MDQPIDADTAAHAPAESRGLALPVAAIIVAFLVLSTGGHIALHWQQHGVINPHQVAMAFFLMLNLIVNFWELGLFFTSDAIAAEYEANREKFAGRPMERINEVFAQRIPITRILSFKEWTGVWSGYCHFDDGYAKRGSFGFNIDVGNGFSTILPATLFGLGMSLEILPARVLGIIGVAMFWQMFYGTVVYFFQFFHAGRHRGHTKKDLWLFVGASNGMWFIFPLWGIALSVWMIYRESFAIFQ